MIRKLLTDRFELTFHHDKREMSAYVLTVGKDGPKLKPTQIARQRCPASSLRLEPVDSHST